MSDQREPTPVPAKDRLPPEEGVVVPTEDLHLVNDHAPTEGVDPVADDGEVLDKRPTDGPV